MVWFFGKIQSHQTSIRLCRYIRMNKILTIIHIDGVTSETKWSYYEVTCDMNHFHDKIYICIRMCCWFLTQHYQRFVLVKLCKSMCVFVVLSGSGDTWNLILNAGQLKLESIGYTYIVFSFHYTHFNVIFGWMPNQTPLFCKIAYTQIVNDISENR